MHFRLASPISLATAASSGAGSTHPGGNRCAGIRPPRTTSSASRTNTFLAIVPPGVLAWSVRSLCPVAVAPPTLSAAHRRDGAEGDAEHVLPGRGIARDADYRCPETGV